MGFYSVASRRLPWVIAVWGVGAILKAAISISQCVSHYHTLSFSAEMDLLEPWLLLFNTAK
jgi:hypothetical protein